MSKIILKFKNKFFGLDSIHSRMHIMGIWNLIVVVLVSLYSLNMMERFVSLPEIPYPFGFYILLGTILYYPPFLLYFLTYWLYAKIKGIKFKGWLHCCSLLGLLMCVVLVFVNPLRQSHGRDRLEWAEIVFRNCIRHVYVETPEGEFVKPPVSWEFEDVLHWLKMQPADRQMFKADDMAWLEGRKIVLKSDDGMHVYYRDLGLNGIDNHGLRDDNDFRVQYLFRNSLIKPD